MVTQADYIKNAFLSGHLTEAMYMQQQEDFVNPNKRTRVWASQSFIGSRKILGRGLIDYKNPLTQQWDFSNSKLDASLSSKEFRTNSSSSGVYWWHYCNRFQPFCNCSGYEGLSLLDVTLYKSIAGALQYVTVIGPEIAFSINKLSQFLCAPTEVYYQACKKELRYLRGTINLGLQFYTSGSVHLDCFSDAD